MTRMARTTEPPATVGTRIRDVRREHGWTQDDLAHAVGVSRSAVAQWETDRAGQIRDNLSRIADVLGVSSEYLLMGREPQASSADELAMLRIYRDATIEDRQLLLRLARRLVKG
jgi:transcriptional regulator with XRE-family HTH domain